MEMNLIDVFTCLISLTALIISFLALKNSNTHYFSDKLFSLFPFFPFMASIQKALSDGKLPTKTELDELDRNLARGLHELYYFAVYYHFDDLRDFVDIASVPKKKDSTIENNEKEKIPSLAREFCNVEDSFLHYFEGKDEDDFDADVKNQLQNYHHVFEWFERVFVLYSKKLVRNFFVRKLSRRKMLEEIEDIIISIKREQNYQDLGIEKK